MARPAAKSRTAMTATEPASASGARPRLSRPIRASSRGTAGPSQLRAPYQNPPAMLPIAIAASRTPASAVAPCSRAKAATATSTAPKATPMKPSVATRVCMPGAERAHPETWDSRRPRQARAGGAVAKAKVPRTPRTAASPRAAAGEARAKTAVASVGPATNMTSTRTASTA